MLQYEIADCLTRIRNAYLRRHPSTKVRKTKFNASVLRVLLEQGSIRSFEDGADEDKYFIIVHLAYANNRPSLKSIKIESRPGLRVYYGAADIPRFRAEDVLKIMSYSENK